MITNCPSVSSSTRKNVSTHMVLRFLSTDLSPQALSLDPQPGNVSWSLTCTHLKRYLRSQPPPPLFTVIRLMFDAVKFLAELIYLCLTY